MLDENKIKLMTKLAIYEKHETDGELVMSRYYKHDYVRFNVLKTLVAATVVYWTIVGAYVFMEFDSLLAKINDIDYFDLMYKLLGWFVAFALIYFAFASVLYNYRYIKAKPGLIKYNSNLKDLIELEGGPMHRTKVVKDSSIETSVSQSVEKPRTGAGTTPKRQTVNRTQIVQQRMQQQEKSREQQIIENVKMRNERIAAQNQARIKREQEVEEERRRIQERRKELERAQLEKIRNQRMQQMARQNHTYQNSNADSWEGRDK